MPIVTLHLYLIKEVFVVVLRFVLKKVRLDLMLQESR